MRGTAVWQESIHIEIHVQAVLLACRSRVLVVLVGRGGVAEAGGGGVAESRYAPAGGAWPAPSK